MSNLLKNNTLYGFIILSIAVALSACGGGSSSSTPTTIPSISTVYYVHNLVFRNGTTLSTGYNAFGQLGNGNLGNRSVPGTLSQYYPFSGFATGGDHSVAFINNSTVHSWGYNAYGQLGNKSTTYSNVPVKTVGITGVNAVAAGAFHTLALANKGTDSSSIWAWGSNNVGQMGTTTRTIDINGNITDPGYSPNPRRVVAFSNISAIAANGYNSMALADGKVWAWGLNGSGQLGVPTSIGASELPLSVAIPTSDGVTKIAAGSASSYAVARDRTLWAWGNNSNGQLGNGTVLVNADIPDTTGLCATATIDSFVPVQVKVSSTALLTDVVQVAAGFHHGLAMLGDGSVWAWGANLFGQLGTKQVAGNSCFAVKADIKNANGVSLKAMDIRAFGSSSMALAEDGAWYVWGNNLYGQLGIGTNGLNNTIVPVPVKMSGF